MQALHRGSRRERPQGPQQKPLGHPELQQPRKLRPPKRHLRWLVVSFGKMTKVHRPPQKSRSLARDNRLLTTGKLQIIHGYAPWNARKHLAAHKSKVKITHRLFDRLLFGL